MIEIQDLQELQLDALREVASIGAGHAATALSQMTASMMLHPAILRMIRLVVRAGRHGRLPVAVCGEMASDPVLLTLLVGLGLREFSMAPTAIPLAKRVLRGLKASEARQAAGRALRARTKDEVEQCLMEWLTPVKRGT